MLVVAVSRMLTTNALILKTYDIGDADRFCILLTEERGRMTAMAKGARKPGSKISGALQSFQELRMDLALHSSGFFVRSAECLHSFDSIRRDTAAFLTASKGTELLLRCLHDTDHDAALYRTVREFFHSCSCNHDDLLFPNFTLLLFRHLGLLPATIAVNAKKKDLHAFCNTLLHDHLSFPLRSAGIASCTCFQP